MKKIGIIGLGMTGKVLLNWLEDEKIDVKGYDKFKNIGSREELKDREIIFLCLPTPYNKKSGYNLSALIENIEFFKGPKIFVIHSTVLPGTTENFQKKYKKHIFLFNPEFLSESTADQDFRKPDRQIIGYTSKKESKRIANEILKILPRSSFERIIPATEAEMVKIANNAFNAMKVIYANQIYDLCQKLEINYDTVRECLAKSKFIMTDSHLYVFHKGYRGVGGKCLPKDLNALIIQYKKFKLKPSFFETIWKINFQYLKKQKLLKKLYEDWLNNKG
jgi:nucleotide sugar dehydrogenase